MPNYYDNWNGLINEVENKVKSILENEIAEEARNLVIKHIKSDIYEAYTPRPGAWVNGSTYIRRNLLPDGVYSELVSDDTLFISSKVTANKSVVKGCSFRNRYPGAFLKLLEVGNMGIWQNGFPRPAITNAQIEIDNSLQNGKLKQIIIDGINR